MLKAVGEAFIVVGAGAKLWLRHWPVLVTIGLFGMAGRIGAIWAAIRISDVNNTLGYLVLVLAPLSAITAIILMLYSLRHSLPTLTNVDAMTGPHDPFRHRERRLLDMLGSVLVPFLAVYASYGFLKDDMVRFTNAIVGEEFLNNQDAFFNYTDPDSTDVARFDLATGWMLFAVVAVAVVLRFGLAKLEGRRAWAGFAFLGAYIEVLWLAAIASQVTQWKDKAWDWAESRRGIEMFIDGWEAMLDRLGPFADGVDAAGAWALDIISSVDSLVIVPIAWLTVGVVVYGHKLVEPVAPPTPRIFRRVPAPVRRWSGELAGEFAEKFTGLLGGLRRLALAGLAPMLVFGLTFLASQRLEDGLNWLARWIIGPHDFATWQAFTTHVVTITHAIGLTVTMCLLAAAIERILATGGAELDVPEDEPVPQTA